VRPECASDTAEGEVSDAAMDSKLREVAELTAKATVAETFLALGVDMSSPASVIETQQDFAWTRTARLTVRKLRMHMITVAVGILTSAGLFAVWQAIISAKAAKGG
jgi:hypothetical protein